MPYLIVHEANGNVIKQDYLHRGVLILTLIRY